MTSNETAINSSIEDPSTARFSLRIPKQGDSRTEQLRIIPNSEENTYISVLIYADGELYRDFQIELAVRVSHAFSQLETDVVSVKNAVIHAAADQLGFQSHYAWQKPPGEMRISVWNHMIANVWGSDVAINGENTDWCGSIGTLAGPIKIVRRRAKSFQETSNKYLNNINPDDLDYRLEHFKPQADWSNLRPTGQC